jgi:hypothetical protein
MDYFDFIRDPARECAIIVHRGLWRTAPENSLRAIEQTIAKGYNIVEIDVRCSSDGEFFLQHDDTLERMTGLDRSIETMTSGELRGLKLRDRDGGPGNAFTDQTLADLRDVFALIRDRIFVHIDVKDRKIIQKLIVVAKEMGVERQIDFWSDLRTQADLAWIRSTITPHHLPFIGKTRLNTADAETQTELLFSLNPLICEIYFDHLDALPAFRNRCTKAGIALFVNTLDAIACADLTDTLALQNPEAVWGRLIDAGISVIQTDEPAALRAFLSSRRGSELSS